MIRACESADPWARRAAHVLDLARAGRGVPEDIEWALSYLGDLDESRKIPAHLHGSGRHIPEQEAA